MLEASKYFQEILAFYNDFASKKIGTGFEDNASRGYHTQRCLMRQIIFKRFLLYLIISLQKKMANVLEMMENEICQTGITTELITCCSLCGILQ